MLTGLSSSTVLFLFLVAFIPRGPEARHIMQLPFVAVMLFTSSRLDRLLLISTNFGSDSQNQAIFLLWKREKRRIGPWLLLYDCLYCLQYQSSNCKLPVQNLLTLAERFLVTSMCLGSELQWLQFSIFYSNDFELHLVSVQGGSFAPA